MKQITRVLRLCHINMVLFRHGFDEIILTTPYFMPLRFLSYINPWNWHSNRTKPTGVRVRLILEALGPIFVKFGQLLSTRRDLFPDEFADELAKLQDNVPPFDVEEVRPLLEKTYGVALETIFKTFNFTPLASASIAQVHEAVLPDGKEVVVKILRPRIEKIIARDIDLLYTVARLIERHWPELRRLHPIELVQEFEKTIYDELDLQREAANASQLRRNFAQSPLLYVPEIYWPYVKKKILVQEKIYGIAISNLAALQAAKINLKRLAENGVEIFFTQVFRDCFFHADMHPGNIFVSPHFQDNPQYIAVDFGIVGTLNPTDQRYLAENMLAFFRRDYRRVAELHVASGWVAATTRVDELESAIRTVCEPIFERPLRDISFGQLLVRLFQIAKRYDMEVQPQLLLLQKTLIHVEGLGRYLYPDLDLWHTAKPFLERWLRQQVGPRAFLKNIKDNAPFWIERLPELPDLIYDLLKAHQPRRNVTPLVPTVQVTLPKRNRRAAWAGMFFGAGTVSLVWALTLLVHQYATREISIGTLGMFGVSLVSFAAAYVLK